VPPPDLDTYERQLLTAVVERAEKAGTEVRTLVVPTNNRLHATLTVARDLKVQEVLLGASGNHHVPDVILGASARYSPRGQLR
jgi:hypothetical protein